jgi:hypothetical protein
MKYEKKLLKHHRHHRHEDHTTNAIYGKRLVGGFNPFNTKLTDIVKISPKLIWGRGDLPPDVKKLLDDYGDAEIEAITIFRTPLSTALTWALEVSSLFQFKKKTEQAGYDKLFHLGMIIGTNKGTFYTEKNEVIRLKKGVPSLSKDTEKMFVSLNGKKLTLNQLFENGLKQAGDIKSFTSYSAKSNNCQKYIMYLLLGSGIGNQTTYDFVKQNTEQIFEGMDWYRKLTNTVTGIGEKADIILQGSGLSGIGIIKPRHKI